MRTNPPTRCCGGCGFSCAVERRVPFVGRSKCCLDTINNIFSNFVSVSATRYIMVQALLYHCFGYDGNSFVVTFSLSLLYWVPNDALALQGASNRSKINCCFNFQHLFSGWLPLLWTSLNFLELDTQLWILSFQIRPSAETLQKWQWRPTQSHRWKCVSLFMWGSLAKAARQQTWWRQIGWWDATIG